MALNANIIMAGQPIDIVGSFARGNELAAQTNQLQDQNALRQVYKTQGAGLLSGNQSSLNALAAIDPNAALGVQNSVLQNQTAQRSFEIMNAQEKRAIAEAAAQMDEREKAEAAASVKQEVMRFIAAPTPEIFDQMVTQAGKPELAGMWANRQVLGAEYVSSVEEALKLSQPAMAEPLSPEGKLAVDVQNGILQPGAASAGGDNQTERDIALLGEIGIPRAEAIRITQLYVVSKDPVTGEQVLIDKRTGRPVDLAQGAQPAPVQQPAPQPVQQAAAPAAQPGQLNFGPQFEAGPNVFGMEGFAKNFANTVTDVIPGIGTAFPEEMRTDNDFRVLREQLVNDVASAYERQPPSWLLQNIQELAPTPGRITEGPDAAASKLRSLGRALQQEMALVDQQLAMKVNPTQRQTLEARRSGLEMALSRISAAVTSIAPPSSVAQEDLDLMNQLLGGN